MSLLDDARHVPVVIVGAGPTGLTLANLLGQLEVATIVVECNAETVQEPRAVSIDDESLRIMQAAGLAESVLADVSSGYGSHYYGPGGRRFAVVEPVARDYGFDKRNAFQQPRLEATLRNGLERFPSVELYFEHELIAVDDTGEGRVALRVRRPDGREVGVSSEYVVACDGARSGIRKSLGIDLVGSSFSERWLIVDIVGTKNRFRHTQVFCNPRRAGITLPGPDGTRRFEFKLHPGESAEEVTRPESVRRLLAAHGPDEHATLRRVRVYTFHARVARVWSRGRVFLLGDAAHLTPPFAGQGMNSGLRDALNLGWKLAAVVQRTLGPELLASYEVERRPHAWQMIRLALRMGRVFGPSDMIRAHLLQIGFRLLNLYPPAADYIGQMKYKPKPRFSDGFLIGDGRGPRRTLVGRLLPQPLVEFPDRRRMLLDDALGPGFSVVVYDVDPDAAFAGVDRKRLDALGVRAFGLTPQAYNPTHEDLACARDVEGLAERTAWAAYRGWFLVLRPDRYVAAAAPCRKAPALIALLQRLFELAGTAGEAALVESRSGTRLTG